MDSIFGMCCVNRQKDDLRDSERQSVSRPVDFIRSRPGLVRVLKWFDDVEEKFRESMREMQEPLESIIEALDEECNEEIIELNKGQETVAKVVDKRVAAEVLHFERRKKDFMQRVIESIEFFRVESNHNDDRE